jgi:anti-sigma factor RsiW
MVDHRFTKAHASEYLDGELPQAGRERVERHASVCPRCRALLASLRRMIETLPNLAAQQGPSVTDGVLERLRRDGGR